MARHSSPQKDHNSPLEAGELGADCVYSRGELSGSCRDKAGSQAVAPGGMTRTAAAAVQPPVTPGGTTRSTVAAVAIGNVMKAIDELQFALADLRSQLVDSIAPNAASVHQTSDGGDDMPSVSSGVSSAWDVLPLPS